MTPRDIIALSRTYLIGWAVTIAALVINASKDPSFIRISLRAELQ